VTTLPDVVAALRQAGLLTTEPVGALPAITGLTADSRRLTAGMLYCAVRGAVQDGHGYLPAVALGGAAAALVETPAAIALPQIVVRDGRRAAREEDEGQRGERTHAASIPARRSQR